jgi:acyl-CoA thioester hydrolase
VAGILHQLEFRLSYGECDPAGIVYFGAYHPWMERTHSEWHFDRDIRSDEMLDRYGVSTVSRHSSVTYEHPARLYDPIRVEMRTGRIGETSYTSRFDFVRRSDDRLLAVGTMTLVFIDADMCPVRVPDWMREHLLSAGEPD